MTALVVTLIVFLVVGAVFLAANLLLGKLVRPNRPSPEKGEVYECGEAPIGSAWIQFDLRFYVVALLFVIFDVELAFFFPWAVVFGSAHQLSQEIPVEKRLEIAQQFGNATDPGNRRRIRTIRVLRAIVLLRNLAGGVRGSLEARRPRMGANPRCEGVICVRGYSCGCVRFAL